MFILIFDTETTSLDKPFCYNVGYVIVDLSTGLIVLKRDFVCEQVWHNPMLFTTAYYADKRSLYVERMRKHETIMNKYGYICQQMIRDIKTYNIEYAFAYNSDFDERVFNFNCDWFKCNNPFDNVEIKDIRGFAHQFLVNDDYKKFCEINEYFTESGNYSTTAETMFRFITNDLDFNEEHTALNDSIIEADILLSCISLGADIKTEYKALRTIPREQNKELKVITSKGAITFKCKGYTVYKSKDTIKLKE